MGGRYAPTNALVPPLRDWEQRGKRRRELRVLSLASCVAAMFTLRPAMAEQSEPASAASAETSAAPRLRPPLAPLPKPPSQELPAPSESQVQILEQLLDRLRSNDPVSRKVALSEVANVDESLLSAIKARIDREAERADRQAMKRLLLDIREHAREVIRQRMKAAGEKGEVDTPDYLEMVVEHARPKNEHWPTLVNVLSLSRMSVHLGSAEAVRVLIHVYVRFDFLRIDTQLQLKKLGDKALPALIEATRHPAPKISGWARRQLDFLGKAIPGEAVQVEDPDVLASVLRAYGFVKDPDAARVVISFTNSERTQIREAARQSVVLFGDVANWQLRDAYENMVGKRPPREWSWDRTARELFNEFDRMRLLEVYEHYERGLEALRGGEFETMRTAFDKVLARSPDFEPRDELIRGYLTYAETNFEAEDPAVEETLLRVERIAQDEATKRRAQSLRLTHQALLYSRQELADQSLLARALELDPDNARAARLLSELQQEPFRERSSFMRVLWPSVLFGLAAVGALLTLFLRKRDRPSSKGA